MNLATPDKYPLVPIAEALAACQSEPRLARALGCSRQTVYQWRWRGEVYLPELYTRRWRDYLRQTLEAKQPANPPGRRV